MTCRFDEHTDDADPSLIAVAALKRPRAGVLLVVEEGGGGVAPVSAVVVPPPPPLDGRANT